MSTLVLARKYRPRDFDSLVGQPHVVQALANALNQQRLHHAYLFTGTRGVGKTTISRILAKSLNCTGADGSGGITAHPCGRCDACREIDAGRYIDYVELDAASNRGVDEITQLLDQSVYKPVTGRFKVYMIDEVHMLSNHAFNAMLKSLEEPPDYLKFVLATTDPQKVPPTVLSRCLQFNLRPLAPQTVHAHLADVLAQEGIDAGAPALQLIARAARGSMRDALSLTDQAIAHGAGAIDEAGVRQMLGAVDRGHAVRLVEALAARQGAAVIAAIDELRELGLSAAGTLEEMAALLQQMAVLQVVPDAADADDPDAASLQRLSASLAPDETQLLYSIVLHGRAEIALAPDEYSGLVMVLLRLLAFPSSAAASVGSSTGPVGVAAPPVAAPAQRPVVSAAAVASPLRSSTAHRPVPPMDSRPSRSLADGGADRSNPMPVTGDLVDRSERAERPSTPHAPAPTVSEPPAWIDAPEMSSNRREGAAEPGRPADALSFVAAGGADDGAAAPPGVDAQQLGDRWTEVVRRMIAQGSIGALVRELALQSQCVALDDASTPMVWRLRVEREMLRAASQCDKLQAALAEVLGRPVKIETEAGSATDSPALRDAAERARRLAEAEQTIENDPLVRALMSQYKTARIVPGSVKSL
jgi:DNA polymerase-3 subunit gamma/tau